MIIERFLAETGNVKPEFAAKLWQATSMACRWQDKQHRDSGEPYLDHVFDVAFQIFEINLGEEYVISAILHDVLEDTDIEESEIVNAFGIEVLENIKAVSKSRKKLPSRDDKVKEWEPRWKVACQEKWQRIFLKVADVLHNLVTLHGLFKDPEKKRRVALYTMNFYLPYLTGEARALVPDEYRCELDNYIVKLSNYAMAQLINHGN